MKDSEADIAIGVLNKLIDQELEAVRAGQRYGNKPLEESSSIRYHAYLAAKDEISKALADAVEERDAGNPFLPQRDELVTQDMHTCDLCGRWWKIYAVSPYLTIWAEVPAWMIWLFWHRIWKTGHKSSHGKEPEQ